MVCETSRDKGLSFYFVVTWNSAQSSQKSDSQILRVMEIVKNISDDNFRH